MKVILLMAVTADGLIAKDSMQLVDWTGKADKKYFVHVTKDSGAMIMGSKTFDTIGQVLPGRKNIVMTRDKTRISRDKDLIFTDQSPQQILSEFESQGFSKVVLIGGAMINTLFMKQGLINEIHVTMVPIIFGTGLTLFSEPMDGKLELIDVQKIEAGHVLLKYRVSNDSR